jgi:ribose transport system substrate-binding protein
MGYKTMIALSDMKAGKAPPADPTYTGLDVCTPETVDTCIAK